MPRFRGIWLQHNYCGGVIGAGAGGVAGVRMGGTVACTGAGVATASQPVAGSSGTSSSATMLMILIKGLTAGPAVSLYGSPTVSPVTAALCASEPLPPKWPSSMYFLALSQAPPPVVMEMATNKPVTMVPISRPPRAAGPSSMPTTMGTTTGSRDGTIISRIADAVSMSTALSYSGLAVPSMMPLMSRNWRRTSTTTAPAARPTASIAMAPNRYGIKPPMNRPTITIGFDRSNVMCWPTDSSAWV